MDWAKIIHHIKLGIILKLHKLRHYWKVIFFGVFLISIIDVAGNILTGSFVQTYSSVKDFLYIILFGYVFYSAYESSWSTIYYMMYSIRDVGSFIYGGLSWLLARAFFNWFFEFFAFVSGFVALPLVLGKITIVQTLLAMALCLPIFLSGLSLVFIFSYFLIFSRSEVGDTIDVIRLFISPLVPYSYAASHFWFYKYLVFLPPVIYAEELRKLLIFGKANMSLLGLATIFTVLYIIVGYLIIKRALNDARKKGILALD